MVIAIYAYSKFQKSHLFLHLADDAFPCRITLQTVYIAKQLLVLLDNSFRLSMKATASESIEPVLQDFDGDILRLQHIERLTSMLRILGNKSIGILTIESGCGVKRLLDALLCLGYINLEVHHLTAIDRHLHFHLCSRRYLMLDIFACDNKVGNVLIEVSR